MVLAFIEKGGDRAEFGPHPPNCSGAGTQPLRGYILVGLIVPLGKRVKDQELAVPLWRNREKLSFTLPDSASTKADPTVSSLVLGEGAATCG